MKLEISSVPFSCCIGMATKEAWDELEKSVIAKIADDVIVGLKGKRVDIIVKKSFA